MDYLGDEATARMLYQDFKFHSIARLPGNEAWTLTGTEIERAILAIGQRQKQS